MSNYLFSYSESLLLSLSKEIEYIKNRTKNINYSLKNCQNKILSKRLISELNNLNRSRLKIANISKFMFKNKRKDLSFEFLFEVSKRANFLQQI